MTIQLACTNAELNLESIVLYSLQTLRFEVIDYFEEYRIVMGVERDRVWRFQRIDSHSISCEVLGRFNGAVEEDDEKVMRDFLQLDVNLPELYTGWMKDEKFEELFEKNRQKLEGIRILKQNPFDVLCKAVLTHGAKTAKVNIQRFCELYGEKIEVRVDEVPTTFYNFPKYERVIEDLDDLKEKLTNSKLKTSRNNFSRILEDLIELGGLKWLNKLSRKSSKKVHKRLSKIKGVADYISDQVCVYGFAMYDVVPTIERLFNVTSMHYLPYLPRFKPNVANYDRDLRKFHSRLFPLYTTWATTLLMATEEIQIELEEGRKPKRTKRR